MHRYLSCLTLLGLLTSATSAHAGALPVWDKKISGSSRFKLLPAFNGEVVLDKETGLVWEKTASLVGNWRSTHRFCALRNTGGRMGWRMPALEELLTLVDPNETTPALPEGAPFENVLTTRFWTANEDAADTTLAVTVNLDTFDLSSDTKTATRKVLCLRSGRGSATGLRGGF
jgi:hypothetical protein